MNESEVEKLAKLYANRRGELDREYYKAQIKLSKAPQSVALVNRIQLLAQVRNFLDSLAPDDPFYTDLDLSELDKYRNRLAIGSLSSRPTGPSFFRSPSRWSLSERHQQDLNKIIQQRNWNKSGIRSKIAKKLVKERNYLDVESLAREIQEKEGLSAEAAMKKARKTNENMQMFNVFPSIYAKHLRAIKPSVVQPLPPPVEVPARPRSASHSLVEEHRARLDELQRTQSWPDLASLSMYEPRQRRYTFGDRIPVDRLSEQELGVPRAVARRLISRPNGMQPKERDI